ncbi:hypothetical protein [Sphingobium fluviale]|uniref:S-adenosyl-L-homocysteine hydrolase n=1 Tax=Sphingobium fluviale TaxID=2506423 RepID=A0A4Q1KM99_9SPHN|nr:hypothetical protein [Sphingobium fluviale]RXR31093.1 hypothetical protein EQG66_02125 [Sphingobium fluviale]
MKSMIAMLAAGLALVSGEAQAAANCWSDTAYEAAQLRDMDMMLMVATLRCRMKGTDFSTDYNKFVVDKRPILAAANIEIQTEFAKSVGKAKALGAYDDFMTKIANSYGNGMTGMACQDFAALARTAAEAPAVRASLVTLANEIGSKPPVPIARCSATVAMASGN